MRHLRSFLATTVLALAFFTPVQAETAKYVCPMHPKVTSAQPGTCPECKMKLVASKPAAYVCPMHPEVTSDKPGKCGKCKMALVKKTTSTGK